MISIKSEKDLEKMREAGRITIEALHLIQEHVVPGVTTAHLDQIIHAHILKNGAKPNFLGYCGFPATACISVNDEVIHGIPGSRILKEGDIVSIDTGCVKDGFHGDAARTFFVGEVAPETKQLVEVTKQSFYEGLKMVRPDNRIGDIGAAIANYVESFGYSVVKDFTGHGIGRALHEDPEVPNYGTAGRGIRLRPGMVLAIEPMVSIGDWRVRILSDKWTTVTADGTLSAHYENTVAVTEGEPEILTAERHTWN